MNNFTPMMLLPSKPKIISENEKIGVYEISDLYPGYGHTLGNSLRRIILSSTEGVAPISIRIKGIDHEFSTISGIYEDVLTIILNIKRISVKIENNNDSDYTISLKKKGIGSITAKDFKCPTGISVLNQDHYIAEITDSKAELDIDVTLDKGIGFLAREYNSKHKNSIGTMNLDATFSPVRAVSYDVADMRVGNRIDFNKLTITIKTDGTAKPHDVLQNSIEIMIQQLRAITGFKGNEEGLFTSDEEVKDGQKKIIDLPISAILVESLDAENIKTISDLLKLNETQLLKFKGVGEKTLQDLKNVIAEYGFVIKKEDSK